MYVVVGDGHGECVGYIYSKLRKLKYSPPVPSPEEPKGGETCFRLFSQESGW